MFSANTVNTYQTPSYEIIMIIMRFFSNLLRWFMAGGKSASTSKISHVLITSDKLTINACAKFDNLLNIVDKNTDYP